MVLSRAFLESKYTQPEWASALAKDPDGSSRPLVGVRIEEVELTGLLSQIVYIDLVGKDDQEAARPLLAGVADGRRKPKSAPPFPGRRQVHDQPKSPDSSSSAFEESLIDRADRSCRFPPRGR